MFEDIMEGNRKLLISISDIFNNFFPPLGGRGKCGLCREQCRDYVF